MRPTPGLRVIGDRRAQGQEPDRRPAQREDQGRPQERQPAAGCPLRLPERAVRGHPDDRRRAALQEGGQFVGAVAGAVPPVVRQAPPTGPGRRPAARPARRGHGGCAGAARPAAPPPAHATGAVRPVTRFPPRRSAGKGPPETSRDLREGAHGICARVIVSGLERGQVRGQPGVPGRGGRAANFAAAAWICACWPGSAGLRGRVRRRTWAPGLEARRAAFSSPSTTACCAGVPGRHGTLGAVRQRDRLARAHDDGVHEVLLEGVLDR